MQTVVNAGYECEVFKHPNKQEKHTDWERAQESVAEWVASLKKPVGILACTDQLGFWLLDACKRAKVLVPEEVAVVSCENDEALTAMSSPPMSSVQFQPEIIGHKACELLERLMKGKSTTEPPILVPPSRIVVRQSSDVVSVEDQFIAAALLFIRLNATRGISVQDVLKEIPMSRAALDYRMKSTIGRTTKAEILRVQLERVKQLLTETDFTLAQIANQTGFQHSQYMAEMFKKKTGKTPGTHRSETQV